MTYFLVILASIISVVQAQTNWEIYNEIGVELMESYDGQPKKLLFQREGDRKPLFLFYSQSTPEKYVYIGYELDALIFSEPIGRCKIINNQFSCRKLLIEKVINGVREVEAESIDETESIVESFELHIKPQDEEGLTILFNYSADDILLSISFYDNATNELLRYYNKSESQQFVKSMIKTSGTLKTNSKHLKTASRVTDGVSLGFAACAVVSAFSAGIGLAPCILAGLSLSVIAKAMRIESRNSSDKASHLDTFLNYSICTNNNCIEEIILSVEAYESLIESLIDQ